MPNIDSIEKIEQKKREIASGLRDDCLCGCGEKRQQGKYFKLGHKKRMMTESRSDAPECNCGCGLKVTFHRDKLNWNEFITGHNYFVFTAEQLRDREKKKLVVMRSDEHRKKMSKSLKGRSITWIDKISKSKKDGQIRAEQRGEFHKERQAWRGICQRCTNPNQKRYKRYGGRGIKVCEAIYKSYETFFEVVGAKPSTKHSIDRIDNNLHYSCGQCKECRQNGWRLNIRWAVAKQQMNNTSRNWFIEWNGETKTLAQWAEFLKMNYGTLMGRLNMGWPVEKAFTKPIAKSRWK